MATAPSDRHGGRAPAPYGLDTYASIVQGVNRIFACVGIVLVAMLMVTILQDVVSRYVLHSGLGWSVDFSRYMLTYLFFFGLAPALASGHHVAVDLFEGAVPQALRRWLPLVASLLCLAFGIILLWFLTRATLRAYTTGALTPTLIAIPVWWVYAAGPLGALQFVLTALLHAIRAWRGEHLFDASGTVPEAAA
jgi:TRAP-type C4-dicarboxylate transport system permease small subunit